MRLIVINSLAAVIYIYIYIYILLYYLFIVLILVYFSSYIYYKFPHVDMCIINLFKTDNCNFCDSFSA